MVYTNFSDYINALDSFRNTSGRIINGVGFNLVNGKWVSDEDFFAHNSKPVFQYPARNNADKQNISSEVITKKRK